MNKKVENLIFGTIALVTMCAMLAAGPIISSMKSQSSQQTQVEQSAAQPKIAVGEYTSCSYTYYFREYKGWIQRRKWNRTYGCWAEPRWYNIQRIK